MPSIAQCQARLTEIDAEVNRLLALTDDPAGARQHMPALEKLWTEQKGLYDAMEQEGAKERRTGSARPAPTEPGRAGRAAAEQARSRQTAAERVLIPVGRGDELYASRFKAYLRTGNKAVFAGLDTTELQTGGFLVPGEFRRGLVHSPDTSFFRQLATVRPPTTTPSVTQAGRRTLATVLWQETLPAADGFRAGAYTLTPQWLSGQVVVSKDILRQPDGDAVVMRELIAAADRAEEAAFIAGDGIRKPLGVFSPADMGIPTGRDVTGPVGLDVFVNALASIPARHLRSPSLRWLLHPTAYAVLLKLEATGGAKIVQPGKGPGGQPTILGVGVELTDDAPAGSGSGGEYQAGDYLAAVGDLAAYDVQDGPDFGVERFNDAVFNAANQVLFAFRRKVDGCPRLPEAFARVKLS